MPEFSTKLLNKRLCGDFSIALFTFAGREPEAFHSSRVTYKVLEGSLDVVVRGARNSLTAGGRITIEPYTPYFKTGSAKIVARDNPPFNPDTVVLTEPG